MANHKIIYGIDLGTTNSAIARFEDGKAKIKKSPTQGDTTPSCVTINPKGKLTVGASAYAQLSKDWTMAFKKPGYKRNSFVEFKRIMGTDETIYSYNLEKCGRNPYLTPEQLSAEVLKTLRSYVLDDDVKEAVITVPALFNNNQRDATKRAAKMAGFDHFELIQEPVAASVAYGLSTKLKNAQWLVFDLGGGTFDAALMKIEDGIMKAVDTAGNNHLGGKDIDNAIVEELILPYLNREFVIDECGKTKDFRNMWKSKAEEAKINLSFQSEYTIQTDFDDYGTDDEDTEFELDLTISQEDLEPVCAPIFQKAIDIAKQLLERNHLNGSDLSSIILVGGPTHSTILRRMLREQISPNVDTSIDPMTAVACGAALYGSTIDVPESVLDKKRDRSKIQLEVAVKSTSVEEFEFAAVKFLKDKSEGYNGSVVMVDFIRTDGEFNTGRARIDETGDVVELRLKSDSTNVFEIRCYDEIGNKLDCEPQSISIIQGIDGIGDAKLPQSLGMATVDDDDDVVFTPFEGLKKNLPLPAYGKLSVKVTTDRDIRPGMATDKIIIPLLQTDKDLDQLKREHKKLKRIYCNHLYDIVVTGDDMPSVLPAGSEVIVSLHADKSGGLDECLVDIPYLNLEIDVTDRLESQKGKLQNPDIYIADIKTAKEKLAKMDDALLSEELDKASSNFQASQTDERDKKDQALEDLKAVLAKIDHEYSLGDWQRMENKLRGIYQTLIDDNRKYGNDKTTAIIQKLREDVDRVIEAKDMDAANQLYHQIWQMDYQMAAVEFYVAWIHQWNQRFDKLEWSNPTRARSLINHGLEIIKSDKATADELRPIAFELSDMLPRSQKPQNIGLLHQQK